MYYHTELPMVVRIPKEKCKLGQVRLKREAPHSADTAKSGASDIFSDIEFTSLGYYALP